MIDEVLKESVVYSSKGESIITVRVELPRGAEAVGLQLDVHNIRHIYTHKQ